MGAAQLARQFDADLAVGPQDRLHSRSALSCVPATVSSLYIGRHADVYSAYISVAAVMRQRQPRDDRPTSGDLASPQRAPNGAELTHRHMAEQPLPRPSPSRQFLRSVASTPRCPAAPECTVDLAGTAFAQHHHRLAIPELK
ncbi:hypothetical protein GCM10022220_61290 [Actinocatenispora rupis]|uniref:Uncharacterized protein n=1 Tax=Actinocatenispora rupis TaxID=519421 RepID=A0A8J3NFX8_9ACTN|nr:hypothetical protein Aru02nite_62540 [Actinocatenispora rupis]